MHDVVPAEKSFTKVTLPLGSRAVMRWGSSPHARTTSEQSPLCSDVFLCLWQKRRHPPAPLLLLSNCDPLRWARSWCAALRAAFFSILRNIDFNCSFQPAASDIACGGLFHGIIRTAFFWLTLLTEVKQRAILVTRLVTRLIN